MRNEKVTFFLIFIIVLSNLFAIRCSSRKENLSTDYMIFSIKEMYPTALEIATEWQQDAYLSLVMASINPPTSSKPLKAEFTFHSNTELLKLNIVIEETSSGYEINTRETKIPQSSDFFEYIRPTPIILENISLDSQEAFQTIFQNGGEDLFNRFYDDNDQNHLWLRLLIYLDSTNLGNDPLWELLHSVGDDSSSKSWLIRMNAITGEIYSPEVVGIP